MTRASINLTAPVGSYESLHAAVSAGANSVYFGIANLNMRAHSAANFNTNDMVEIANICRQNNIQLYLALNVIAYDSELTQIKHIIDTAKTAGIAAIIAADYAVIHHARHIGLPIHISTQANVSNADAVRFYAQFADAIVLARELNLQQVRYIYDTIVAQNICGPNQKPVQIEIFCHGALCLAISGKCFMSLHHNNASANRGNCLQTCRRSYVITDEDNGSQMRINNRHIMSPKDLCTIDFLDKILDAGATILKIEGRARPPEYVKRTCECYNIALDAICSGTYSPELQQDLKQQLSQVFNRGFWDGYYLGKRLCEHSECSGSQATCHKDYAAKVINYYDRIGVAELLLESGSLAIGSPILIMGKTTGVVEMMVEEMHAEDGSAIEMVEKGQVFSLKTPQQVRRGDKLYRWVENDGADACKMDNE